MLKKFLENQNDQYVFWILSEFFENKYDFENVNCDIKILNKNDEVIKIENLHIGTPYYNTSIQQLMQKQGRSKGYGLPLFFDNFSELSNLKSIEITWELKIGSYIILLHKIYELNFIFEEDKKVYYLETENYYSCYVNNIDNILDKHINFYESAKYYHGSKEDSFYKNLRVGETPLTKEEVQSNYFHFMKRENVLKNMCKNEDYTLEVFSFAKKIDLIPKKFSESNLRVRISGAKNFSKLFNWAEIG
ncbi:MAG: hypothetical protein ACRDB9_08550 [Cetobacterium sp.]